MHATITLFARRGWLFVGWLGLAMTGALAVAVDSPGADAAGPTEALDVARFDAGAKLERLAVPKFGDDDADTNFSGAAYNPATRTLLVVDNEPNHGDHAGERDQGDLYEYETDGTYRRRIDLVGFSDPEGIALIGPDPERPDHDRYVISEERIGRLAVVSIDRSKEDRRAVREESGPVIDPKPNPIDDGNGEANDGLEGVAYDPEAKVYYIVKEHGPTRGVYRVQPDGRCEGVAIEGLTREGSDKNQPLGDLADIQYHGGMLLILSEKSNRILAVRLRGLAGEIIGQFPPAGKTLPHKQPEGIAVSDDGHTLWVIGEPREFVRYRRG